MAGRTAAVNIIKNRVRYDENVKDCNFKMCNVHMLNAFEQRMISAASTEISFFFLNESLVQKGSLFRG